ncbi:uncharacterized protein LOC108675080 isoform X3 [Hyalella azteca]|uniref:Uncharacterized protein LOC108675080 isoform X3 n=1 Tax=Hyalella azteca TaxID=294128 RepID=A0A979FGV1_HYAAZ|nr:uncharacterized protein LOC108675080 isoform X3 [Hyalella azteca]
MAVGQGTKVRSRHSPRVVEMKACEGNRMGSNLYYPVDNTGYLYRVKRKRGSTLYFSCARNGCKATANFKRKKQPNMKKGVMKGLFEITSNHSHAEDPSVLVKLKFESACKKRSMNEETPYSVIIKEEKQKWQIDNVKEAGLISTLYQARKRSTLDGPPLSDASEDDQDSVSEDDNVQLNADLCYTRYGYRMERWKWALTHDFPKPGTRDAESPQHCSQVPPHNDIVTANKECMKPQESTIASKFSNEMDVDTIKDTNLPTNTILKPNQHWLFDQVFSPGNISKTHLLRAYGLHRLPLFLPCVKKCPLNPFCLTGYKIGSTIKEGLDAHLPLTQQPRVAPDYPVGLEAHLPQAVVVNPALQLLFHHRKFRNAINSLEDFSFDTSLTSLSHLLQVLFAEMETHAFKSIACEGGSALERIVATASRENCVSSADFLEATIDWLIAETSLAPAIAPLFAITTTKIIKWQCSKCAVVHQQQGPSSSCYRLRASVQQDQDLLANSLIDLWMVKEAGVPMVCGGQAWSGNGQEGGCGHVVRVDREVSTKLADLPYYLLIENSSSAGEKKPHAVFPDHLNLSAHTADGRAAHYVLSGVVYQDSNSCQLKTARGRWFAFHGEQVLQMTNSNVGGDASAAVHPDPAHPNYLSDGDVSAAHAGRPGTRVSRGVHLWAYTLVDLQPAPPSVAPRAAVIKYVNSHESQESKQRFRVQSARQDLLKELSVRSKEDFFLLMPESLLAAWAASEDQRFVYYQEETVSSELLCPHGKIRPLAASKMKCIRKDVVNKLLNTPCGMNVQLKYGSNDLGSSSNTPHERAPLLGLGIQSQDTESDGQQQTSFLEIGQMLPVENNDVSSSLSLQADVSVRNDQGFRTDVNSASIDHENKNSHVNFIHPLIHVDDSAHSVVSGTAKNITEDSHKNAEIAGATVNKFILSPENSVGAFSSSPIISSTGPSVVTTAPQSTTIVPAATVQSREITSQYVTTNNCPPSCAPKTSFLTAESSFSTAPSLPGVSLQTAPFLTASSSVSAVSSSVAVSSLPTTSSIPNATHPLPAPSLTSLDHESCAKNVECGNNAEFGLPFMSPDEAMCADCVAQHANFIRFLETLRRLHRQYRREAVKYKTSGCKLVGALSLDSWPKIAAKKYVADNKIDVYFNSDHRTGSILQSSTGATKNTNTEQANCATTRYDHDQMVSSEENERSVGDLSSKSLVDKKKPPVHENVCTENSLENSSSVSESVVAPHKSADDLKMENNFASAPEQEFVNGDIVCQHGSLNPQSYVSWLPEDSYSRILQLCHGYVHEAVLQESFDLCVKCQDEVRASESACEAGLELKRKLSSLYADKKRPRLAVDVSKNVVLLDKQFVVQLRTYLRECMKGEAGPPPPLTTSRLLCSHNLACYSPKLLPPYRQSQLWVLAWPHEWAALRDFYDSSAAAVTGIVTSTGILDTVPPACKEGCVEERAAAEYESLFEYQDEYVKVLRVTSEEEILMFLQPSAQRDESSRSQDGHLQTLNDAQVDSYALNKASPTKKFVPEKSKNFHRTQLMSEKFNDSMEMDEPVQKNKNISDSADVEEPSDSDERTHLLDAKLKFSHFPKPDENTELQKFEGAAAEPVRISDVPMDVDDEVHQRVEETSRIGGGYERCAEDYVLEQKRITAIDYENSVDKSLKDGYSALSNTKFSPTQITDSNSSTENRNLNENSVNSIPHAEVDKSEIVDISKAVVAKNYICNESSKSDMNDESPTCRSPVSLTESKSADSSSLNKYLEGESAGKLDNTTGLKSRLKDETQQNSVTEEVVDADVQMTDSLVMKATSNVDGTTDTSTTSSPDDLISTATRGRGRPRGSARGANSLPTRSPRASQRRRAAAMAEEERRYADTDSLSLRVSSSDSFRNVLLMVQQQAGWSTPLQLWLAWSQERQAAIASIQKNKELHADLGNDMPLVRKDLQAPLKEDVLTSSAEDGQRRLEGDKCITSSGEMADRNSLLSIEHRDEKYQNSMAITADENGQVLMDVTVDEKCNGETVAPKYSHPCDGISGDELCSTPEADKKPILAVGDLILDCSLAQLRVRPGDVLYYQAPAHTELDADVASTTTPSKVIKTKRTLKSGKKGLKTSMTKLTSATSKRIQADVSKKKAQTGRTVELHVTEGSRLGSQLVYPADDTGYVYRVKRIKKTTIYFSCGYTGCRACGNFKKKGDSMIGVFDLTSHHNHKRNPTHLRRLKFESVCKKRNLEEDLPAAVIIKEELARWQLREEDVNLNTLNSTLYKARWRLAVDDPSSVPDVAQGPYATGRGDGCLAPKQEKMDTRNMLSLAPLLPPGHIQPQPPLGSF